MALLLHFSFNLCETVVFFNVSYWKKSYKILPKKTVYISKVLFPLTNRRFFFTVSKPEVLVGTNHHLMLTHLTLVNRFHFRIIYSSMKRLRQVDCIGIVSAVHLYTCILLFRKLHSSRFL